MNDDSGKAQIFSITLYAQVKDAPDDLSEMLTESAKTLRLFEEMGLKVFGAVTEPISDEEFLERCAPWLPGSEATRSGKA